MTVNGSWRTYEESSLSVPLQAALDAFVEHGYHGTSVRQIAEKAGLSVPGLYHHYRSKQALLVGLTDAMMADLLDRSARAEHEAGPSPELRFDAVVESLLLFHMHRKDEAFLGSTETRSLEARHRTAYIGKRDQQQRMVDNIVIDGVNEQMFTTSHPLDAARAVTTMCIGVAGWYRPDGRLGPDDMVGVHLDIARRIVGARTRDLDRSRRPVWSASTQTE